MATEYGVSDCGESNCSGVDMGLDDPMRVGIHHLWVQNQFMDFKIKVEHRQFEVHKVIMASMSDYFEAMLSAGMAEGEKDSVVIKGVSANVMEILIDYIYTNHMNISEGNAADVLGGAVYFQMESAIKVCTQFMVDNLGVDNWFDVLALFKSYSLRDAVQDVRQYGCSIVAEIVSTGKNKQLSYGDLHYLAKNWKESENRLFCFILEWFKADEVDKKKYIDKLLHFVRFPLMTPSELAEIKEMAQDSANPSQWESFIDKALQYHVLPLHQRVPESTKQTKPRNPASFVSFAQQEPRTTGHFYDPSHECFVKNEGLKPPIKGALFFRQIEVNNFLIVCTDDLAYIPRTRYWFIFDPRTLQWSRMTNPAGNASGWIMTHDNKHLYVFNGDDYMEDVSDEIIRYDFQTDTWSDFGKLVKPVHSFSPCVMDNGLYVSGGFLMDKGAFSQMDRLDLVTHEWESKAPMLRHRCDHSMYVMNILQGEFLCIIEKDWTFDYYSASDDQWSTCTFCFNSPPPKLTAKPWVRGNSVFVSENQQQRKHSGDRGLSYCVVVTFNEDWDEATVEFLHEDERRFDCSALHTVLAIDHHHTSD